MVDSSGTWGGEGTVKLKGEAEAEYLEFLSSCQEFFMTQYAGTIMDSLPLHLPLPSR